MWVRWLGPGRVVDGGMRLPGEEYDLEESQVTPHLADGACEEIDGPTPKRAAPAPALEPAPVTRHSRFRGEEE